MALHAGSIVRWWHATSRWRPGISATLHAKRSAFSDRNAFSCLLASSGRPNPILTHLVRSSLSGTSSKSPSDIWSRVYSELAAGAFFASGSSPAFPQNRLSISMVSMRSIGLVASVLLVGVGLASSQWRIFIELKPFVDASKHLQEAFMSPCRVAT